MIDPNLWTIKYFKLESESAPQREKDNSPIKQSILSSKNTQKIKNLELLNPPATLKSTPPQNLTDRGILKIV